MNLSDYIYANTEWANAYNRHHYKKVLKARSAVLKHLYLALQAAREMEVPSVVGSDGETQGPIISAFTIFPHIDILKVVDSIEADVPYLFQN